MYFFFNDTATTEIYTLSLHDALPICPPGAVHLRGLTLPGLVNGHSHAFHRALRGRTHRTGGTFWTWRRSEEHTSELQSRQYLVCRLLLEKKKIVQEYKKHLLPP